MILWMIEDEPHRKSRSPWYFGSSIPRLDSAIGGSLAIHRAFAQTGKSGDGNRCFASEMILGVICRIAFMERSDIRQQRPPTAGEWPAI
jgi:hypothetical protein